MEEIVIMSLFLVSLLVLGQDWVSWVEPTRLHLFAEIAGINPRQSALVSLLVGDKQLKSNI